MNQAIAKPGVSSMQRLGRLNKASIIATNLAILLAAASLVHALSVLVLNSAEFTRLALQHMEIADQVQTLSKPQLWLVAGLWSSMDMLGVFMLFQVRSLFKSFQTNGVFTSGTAQRLRRIGWCVFFLGPVSVLSELFGTLILTLWQTGDRVYASIVVDQGDIYAIVVGLVIVAVGHIMLEAARLSEENNAFV